MRRTAYLVAFCLLAAAAALLTVRAQHTTSVVVASHDLRAGAQVQASDLEVHRMHDDGVPAGALSSTDAAVGQYVAWPLTAGEAILARSLRAQRSGSDVVGGLDVPPGFRAVAVPVQPAAAVGGVLVAGDRVDVFATALPGRDVAAVTTASAASQSDTAGAAAVDGGVHAAAVLLGRDVLVLQLRSDQGQALDQGSGDTVHGLNFGGGKLGSVVLAIPDVDVAAYAAAVTQDAIYLALSVG